MRISDWSSDVCSSDLSASIARRCRPSPTNGRWRRFGRLPCFGEPPSTARRPKPSSSCVNSPEGRSEEHTSELQSLMRISYAVFCLKKKKPPNQLTAQTLITHTHTINDHSYQPL